MSKESNVEKMLHEKVKSITDDLAGQMTTLENKYHHKEISFDKYIEMGELYSKLNTEAVEALIASEKIKLLREINKKSGYWVNGISEMETFVIDTMVDLEATLTQEKNK